MTDDLDNGVRDRFVQSRAHGRMHYREAGSGEPLILIHTNGASAHQYDRVMDLLAGRFRVLAWDLPGHGDSDRIVRHYRVEDYADAVIAFMDALGLARAHVCGCSIGGSVSVALAGRYSDRLLSTVIVECPFRSFDEWGARWGHTEANFGLPTQTRTQVEQRVGSVDDALLTRWNIDRNKAGAWTMMDVMWAIREFDVATAIAAARCPAMVLYGRTGPTIVDEARFRAAAPAIPIEVLEGSGHFPMLDEPEVFAEQLTGFCGSAVRAA